MKYYKVTNEFISVSTTTGKPRTFRVGETITAQVYSAGVTGIGSLSGLVADGGFPILNKENVKEIPNPVIVFAGMGVLLVAVAFVVVRFLKK